MFKPQTPDQVGDTISRLWLFAFLTIVFRDLHEMSTASTINGILAGTFDGNPVTDQGLVLGGVALLVMITSFVLTTVLIPSAARRLNLVVAPLALFGLAAFPPNDPDDYLLGAATGFALILILYRSWTWPVQAETTEQWEADYVR